MKNPNHTRWQRAAWLAGLLAATHAPVALGQASCPGDIDGSGRVDAVDASLLLAGWGGPNADLNGDGLTGAADLSILLAAWGECPGCANRGWVGGFGQVPSMGAVRDMIEFDDGSGLRLWIGGRLSDVAGYPAANIAQWNGTHFSVPQGGLTTTLGALVTAEVFDLEVFNGQLYAAGSFNQSPGVGMVNGIARWDGTAWQPLGTGLQIPDGSGGFGYALEVYQGQLYVAGDFDFAGGQPASNIARWDGFSWSPVDVGVSGRIRDLETYNDGTTAWLVAGGLFNRSGTASTSTGGIVTQQISRWSPQTGWQPFLYTPPGSSTTYNGLPSEVFALEATAAGGVPALYAGGIFSNAAGNAASDSIVRWSANAWSSLAVGLAGTEVRTIEIDESGGTPTIYAGGTMAGLVVRFTGTGWAALGAGLASPVTPRVYAIHRGQHGFLAGGEFFSSGGRTLRNIARFDGAAWLPMMTGMQGQVNAIVAMPGTAGAQVFLGGQITEADGRPMSNAVVWNGSGFSLLGGGVNGTVNAAVEYQGSLVVAGSFTAAGTAGIPTSNIARWNGTGWSQLLGGVNGTVTCMLAVGGDLYVGGSFSSANGQPATAKVARWNGTAWSSVAATTVPTPIVKALAHYQGRLHVGGNNSGTGLPPLHRLEGGAWVAMLGPSNGWQSFMPITSMAVVDFDGPGPGGEVLAVGGTFTALDINGQPLPGSSGVGLWNGQSWSGTGTSLPSGSASVASMAVFPEGNRASLVIVGQFSTLAGQPIDRVARYDGAQWASMGASFPSEPSSAAVLFSVGTYARNGSPEVMIGGNFDRGPAHEPCVASWGCRD